MVKPIAYVLRQTIVCNSLLMDKWQALKKKGLSAEQADYILWATVISKDLTDYNRKCMELMPASFENEVTQDVAALFNKYGWRLTRNAIAQLISNELYKTYVDDPKNQGVIDALMKASTKVEALPVNPPIFRKATQK